MDSMLNLAIINDIGTRDEQQDCAMYFTRNNFCAAVVCDGMGGLDGGRIAGKYVAEGMLQLIKARDPKENISDLFLRSVDILDEKISALKNESGDKIYAGTTIVAVVIDGNKLYWLSVGDSRLYLMRQNEMICATRDHNYSLILDSMPAGYEPSDDDISKKDALVSYIGMGGIKIMDISSNPLMLVADDIILLTTDGLYKSLTDEKIKNILSRECDVQEKAEELLKEAKECSPSSRDNTSFVLIKFIGE